MPDDIAITLGSTMQTLLWFGTPPVLQIPELQTTERSTRARCGRPPGSGSCVDADIPLVVELNRRVQTGEAASRTEAARQLADQAYGPNTEPESKAWRLLRRHREYFSANR